MVYFFIPTLFQKSEGDIVIAFVRLSIHTHEWTLVGYFKFPKLNCLNKSLDGFARNDKPRKKSSKHLNFWLRRY